MNMCFRRIHLAILCVFAVIVSQTVQADYINPLDYDNSMLILFDSYTGTTSLSNFPALIKLTEGRDGFSFSGMESDDYSDLRFTDASGTNSIPFEAEAWNSTAPAATIPTNIPGCQVWFKADADVLTNASGSVTNWLDQSGNGRNATQTTEADQPVVEANALNSLPSVHFDGSGDRLSYDGTFLAGSEYTVFIVEGRRDNSVNWILRGSGSSANQNLIIGYRDNTTFSHAQYGNDYDMTVAGYSSQEFTVYTVDCGAVAKHTWRNGALLGSKNDSTKLSSYAGATIGGNGGYNGDVAEVIIFNRTLTVREMAAIHTYLEEKYAITITQPDSATMLNATLWVKVPELTNNASIYAYWGNTSATELPAYTTNGVTWSEGFGAVWHMDSANPADSTSNRNDGVAGNTPLAFPALIENGVLTDEADHDEIFVANTDSVDPTNNFTATLWFNTTMEGVWYRNLMGNFGNDGANNNFWGLGWLNPNELGFVVRVSGGDTRISAGAINDGQWHQMTGQKEGDTIRLYVDGVLAGSGIRAGSPANDDNIVFCNHYSGSFVSALLDEARISTVSRSPDWIKAAYDNQASPEGFSRAIRNYYYDSSDTAGLQDGNGTWSNSATNWNSDAAGSASRINWDANGIALLTAGGTSAITAGDVEAGQIVIEGTGYSIAGGTISIHRSGIIAGEDATISADLELLESQSWDIASGKTLTLNGVTGGDSTLTKSGQGKLTLSAQNTYSGGTLVDEGTLELNSGGGAGALRGELTVESTAQLDLMAANSLGYTSGAKVNTLNINGSLVNNTATGDNGWGITINISGGELRSAGGDSLYSLGGGSAINTIAGSGTALISGRINLREGNTDNTLTFNVADDAADEDLLISATISEEGGAHAIAKSGPGLMNLTATNTYSGGTTINEGILLANNTSGSATGSGTVTIDGGVLGGAGTVASVVFGSNGGFLSPGNGIGTLTVNGDLNLTSSSVAGIDIEIGSAASYDQLVVTGDVSLADAPLSCSISGTVLPTDMYFIIVNTGPNAVSGTFDGIPQGSTVDIDGYTFTISYEGDQATSAPGGGNDVVLYNGVDITTPAPQWKEISFPGYDRVSTLTNFPVLVALQEGSGGFSYNKFVSTDGDDLRFFTAQNTGSTELNYEIDYWNTNGISYAWVQIPEFSAGTTIWAYWGDTTRSTKPGYTSDGSVWSENFGAVWHMNQADVVDSTANANNGTAYDNPAVTDARIGRGVDFVSTTAEVIKVPNDASIDPPDNFTASAWYKGTFSGGWFRNLMGNFGDGNNGTFWGIGWNGANLLGVVSRVSGQTTYVSGTTDRFTDGGWHLMTFQKEGSTIRLFVDGYLVNTGTRSGNVNNGEQIWIGWHGTTANQHIVGTVDECRICDTLRSADWIWACYANQADPVAFTGESAPASYRDSSTAYGIQAGDMTWDSNSTAAWSDDTIFGSDPLLTWSDALKDACFTEGASTVSVVSGVTANRAVVESGGCSFSGEALSLTRGLDALESVTFDNDVTVTDDQTWYVAEGMTVTMNNKRITGNAKLTKTGGGDLYLNNTGSDDYRVNTIVINEGRIRFKTGNTDTRPLQNWPITITINPDGTARTENPHALGDGDASGYDNWLRIAGTLDLGAEQYLRSGSEMFGGLITGTDEARLYNGATLNIRTADQTATISAQLNSVTADNNLNVEDGAADVDLLVSGKMIGLGFRKRGNGTMEITSSGNSYTNTTAIEAGTLLVNNSSGTGTGTSAVYINGGTLGGNGSVGSDVSFGSSGGTIAPGMNTLTADCDVDFTTTGSKSLDITVDGIAEGEFSVLSVNGAVTLNNATLNLTVNADLSGVSMLPIIVNDGVDAVNGIFNGLPEGSNISAGNTSFKIYYSADADSGNTAGGNDVMLVSAMSGTVFIVR